MTWRQPGAGGNPEDSIAATALPTLNIEVIGAHLGVRIAGIDQNTEAIVCEGVAEQETPVRRGLVISGCIGSRKRARQLQSGVIKRLRVLDIDGRADCTAREGGVGGLQYVHLTDELGAD